MRETGPGSSETRTNTRSRNRDANHLQITSCQSPPKKKQRTFLQRVRFSILPSLRLTAAEFEHGMKNGRLSLAHRAIRVDGPLELNGGDHMTLPEGLRLSDLTFRNWSGPVAPPEGVAAKRVAILECTTAANLTLSKQIDSLVIEDCSGCSLTLSGTLSETGYSRADSLISRCSNLTINLSKGLHMGRSLNIGYSDISHLSGTLSVSDDLHCYCSGLTSLPERMSIGGTLELKKVYRLTSLPERMIIGRALVLTDIRDLTSLPKRISLGGNVCISGCPRLTSLPRWITRLGYTAEGKIREVMIQDTGISIDILVRLRNAPSTGMRYYLPVPE